jgi:hypothetical protein
MRDIKVSLLFSFLLAAKLVACAQDRKPGLYDLTVVTTTISPSPSSYPPRASQVCLTSEMIEKYGAIVPEQLSKVCQLVNVVKKQGGMTAEMVCSGGMTGKGTVEVNWTDSEHAKGTTHFSGAMHPGDNEIKIEWTATTTSVYKGPDCGLLAPPAQTAPPASATPPSQ